MPSVAVVSRGSAHGATPVAPDADLSSFDIVAADADHLSGLLRRVVREGLSAAVLPLRGDTRSDAKRIRKPPASMSAATLVVCDSGISERQYGFSLGLGAWFHAADMSRVGGIRALRGAVAPVSATVTVNGEVIAQELTLAGASTTRQFPMKWRAPTAPGAGEFCFVWNNLDAKRLLSHAFALMRGKDAPSHRAGVATRVTFDIAETGYSLDGALHTAQGPRVVSVRRGPDVRVCGA
jgi:hypothetical protein